MATHEVHEARSAVEHREAPAKTYIVPVHGLACVADARRLEHRLLVTVGVLRAVVNSATDRAYVTVRGALLSEADLRAVIAAAGFRPV